ncbi:LysR family transcriptional regulator [Pusillimonas noertemannii]|uniref:DNA-binding transcriptional LysR family regulator n=1 Tax=Pusillimonas noertemannii TaxID=305977 RepID=A0A2U1CNE4_9BURK|nr:LysR family transcriptional regulator [Pusillimonas noertemannii]NYT68461.1 LysR family transcriptional regulator [Pusillimonas noertemannii]PVY62522.1 DNA-binding transcriptional LysR family regulator [Pusillimonas noertemannii]TFL10526.1 LysR family transcriptional regulator [Pusillimonas noertemannii]
MADSISELELFIQIAAAGSITMAAIKLDSSPPAVSRRLAAMEARLGVRLIERSARRFELTEAGHALLERAQRIVAEVEEAEAEVASHARKLVGRLSIGAMQRLIRTRLAPEVARFAQLHPQLQVEFRLSERPLDLEEDELDILFQIDVPSAANVVARKLTDSRFVLCASPDYLKRRGQPARPDDLLQHDCLCFVRGRRLMNSWTVSEGGVVRDVTVEARLASNSGDVLHQWIQGGFGIGMQFLWDVEEELAAGRLVECLAPYTSMSFSLYAVYAYKGYRSPKMEQFLKFLDDRFGDGADAA